MPDRDRWEYQTVVADLMTMHQVFADHGKEGWEAYSVHEISGGTTYASMTCWRIFFKRRISQ
jgi:hypothetical protein